MNCQHCGAPLKYECGADALHCEYCGSYEFPVPGLDGVTLLQQPSAYVCPICGETLIEAVVGRVRILSCPTCRGNLIEQSAMHPILSQAQDFNSLPEPEKGDAPSRPSQAERARALHCPKCRKPLETYPYGASGSLLIQGCATCMWIWLDFGELSRIRSAYQKERRREQEQAADYHRTVETRLI